MTCKAILCSIKSGRKLAGSCHQVMIIISRGMNTLCNADHMQVVLITCRRILKRMDCT